MRINILLVSLIVVLLFLQYRIWFEPGGMREMLQMKKNLTAQLAENQLLKQRNAALMFQIQRLRAGEEATEARARNTLGMIKSGETFYQIIPGPTVKEGKG
jgi:cell division protein FtsB